MAHPKATADHQEEDNINTQVLESLGPVGLYRYTVKSGICSRIKIKAIWHNPYIGNIKKPFTEGTSSNEDYYWHKSSSKISKFHKR